MKHYTVIAQRADKWWMLQCKEAPGAISQVKKLSEFEIMRESIAWVSGILKEDIELKLEVRVNPEHDDLIREYDEMSKQLDELASQQRKLQHTLASKLLNEDNLSYRDVGTVLHLSHQRIGQLVESGQLS